MKAETRHRKLYETLRNCILLGEYGPGDKLPSEHELTSRYGVSRITVMRALNDLQRDGLIWRKQGAGTFVKVSEEFKGRLGVMIPGMGVATNQSVFPEIIHKIIRLASQQGWQVLHGDLEIPSETDASGRQPVEVARRLISHGANAVVFCPFGINTRGETLNHNVIAEFSEQKIPVILLGADIVQYPDRSDYDVIGLDDQHAGFLLGQHLISRECRNVAFVGLDTRAPAHGLRLLGLKTALGSKPGNHLMEINLRRDGTDQTVIPAMIRKHRIDAVVGENDEVASWVMKYLGDARIPVPGEVKVAGFDNAPIAAQLPVPLTSVAQPTDGMAAEVMITLRERLRNPALNPRWVRVHGRLVTRESTVG